MRKAFNITDQDMDILPHLQSQTNMSKYLISLVRKDMQQADNTETQIIKIVESYLRKHNLVVDKKKTNEDYPMDSALSILGS
jgi:hypothetical protein